jgi:hypothetical protein
MTRKTVMTKDSIRMLLEGFCQGLKVNQACIYANICKQTFYNYCNKHEGFLEHCHNLRKTPIRSEITGEDGEAIKIKAPEITVNFTNDKD